MRLRFLLLATALLGPPAEANGETESGRCTDGDAVAVRYRELTAAGPGTLRALDRQAILRGRTVIETRLTEACRERLELRRFTVSVGSATLCRLDEADSRCQIDLGDDLDSWILDLRAELVDRAGGRERSWSREIVTLAAGLDADARRFLASDRGASLEERSRAESIPYDEITRTVLVSDRKGRTRDELAIGDFSIKVGGSRTVALLEAVPVREVAGRRLLFLLVDVADFVRRRGPETEWRAGYGDFVRGLMTGLAAVADAERRLLVVRYAGSPEASPVVGLDGDGRAQVEAWLRRPPRADWRAGKADRSAALGQAYDVFLHDFDGQPIGLVISGGRDEGGGAAATLSMERLRELNPVWGEEHLAATVHELDLGRTDLFPHTHQRGFPLYWGYVPGTNELTTRRFGLLAEYFRKFGGEVYRLADLRHPAEERGHRAGGGTVFLDDILRGMFEELESSYRLRIRIANPRQKRAEKSLTVRVRGAEVRTQAFYTPSASLRENIVRYLSSRSKERRFRAAHAARDFPFDDAIRGQVIRWLEQEPSAQVRRVLEESRLLIELKRCRARRPDACLTLQTTGADQVAVGNRELLGRIGEIVGDPASD